MKKILSLALVLVMVLSVAALVGCGGEKAPADDGETAATALKFGLGVVSSYGEAKDADGETNGEGEFDTTAVAVLLDADGKIAAIDLDTAQIKTAWTSEGKVIATEELRTKYDKGADYGMAAAITYDAKNDKNGDGKTLEWNEQADAFMATAKGKTLEEPHGAGSHVGGPPVRWRGFPRHRRGLFRHAQSGAVFRQSPGHGHPQPPGAALARQV